MCGIAGFYQKELSVESMQSIIDSMSSTLVHRGPDAGGSWLDHNNGIALGHRRLSILDLSPTGHQPMLSASGRFSIVFNGEIYNHLDLRNHLAAEGRQPDWRGNSDTETLLYCFLVWGIEKTLKSAVGMFALALWDRQERHLTLARDRFGEKPLYYGEVQGGVFFASELKALKKYPGASFNIDSMSIPFLLRQSCIPAPYTIYKNIKKLLPGHYLTIRIEKGGVTIPAILPFWSFTDMVNRCLVNPFTGSDDEAIDYIEAELTNSISRQLLSDVPVGAFLSGGIDSSTIVALMQKQSSRPVNTFTIGFAESQYNEAHHAKAVAKHLGTNHTELYIQPKDALDVIPKIPHIYCEPFSDSSQIPTYLVSQLARKDVTVALSGDAGDELFCGYDRYIMAVQYWGEIKKLPIQARKALAWLIDYAPTTILLSLLMMFKRIAPIHEIQKKISSFSGVLRMRTDEDFFRRMTFKPTIGLCVNAETHPLTFGSHTSPLNASDTAHWMMAMDSLNYLPNDILVKVDRAAMANSLETRVPMLDHRFAEAAWRMPLNMKLRDGRGKWILRQVLYRHVPQVLVDRPKRGFGVPLDSWIRGPLREWAETLLDESTLNQEGYFNAKLVRKLFDEHISGAANRQHELWDILMFQAWKDVQ